MNREVRVGVMFTLAVLIIGAALYYMGSFQEQVRYKIRFDKVSGLARDSPVQFNGVPIGRVTDIVLAEDSIDNEVVPVIVTVAVHRSARNHIRASTEADIRSVGVLGDKMILLVTEDYTVPVLEEGDLIRPTPKQLDVDKLLEQGTDIVADATSIARDLRVLLDRLAHQDGPLQTMWNDEELAENMRRSVASLQSFLDNDDGLLAILMKDPEFAATVKGRVDTITADMAAFSSDLEESDGLLPLLLEDEGFRDEVQQRVLSILDRSETFVRETSEARGLLYTLTRDEAYGARMSQNLEKASLHLASILEKVDEGDGTAALMLNDPSVYQGIYEVVYGLQHSSIAKWYIRRQQRKGAKRLEQDEEKTN